MDYVATYPNAYTRYYASDMILNIDSNAAYLVDKKYAVELRGIIIYHLIQKSQGILPSMEKFISNVKHYDM